MLLLLLLSSPPPNASSKLGSRRRDKEETLLTPPKGHNQASVGGRRWPGKKKTTTWQKHWKRPPHGLHDRRNETTTIQMLGARILIFILDANLPSGEKRIFGVSSSSSNHGREWWGSTIPEVHQQGIVDDDEDTCNAGTKANFRNLFLDFHKSNDEYG